MGSVNPYDIESIICSAKNSSTEHISELQSTVVEHGTKLDIVLFATRVDGSDIELLQHLLIERMVIESFVTNRCQFHEVYDFTNSITQDDVDVLQKCVLTYPDAEDIYCLSAHFYDKVNLQAMQDMLISLRDNGDPKISPLQNVILRESAELYLFQFNRNQLIQTALINKNTPKPA